jgi:hypothetical protein
VRSARHADGCWRTRAGRVVVPADLRCSRPDVALLRTSEPSRAFSRVVEAFRPVVGGRGRASHARAIVDPGRGRGES